MNPLVASRATVQQKSSPRDSREKTSQKENAAELTNRAVSELAIPLLQRETQLFQRRKSRLLTPDCLLLGADSWRVEFSSARLSQSFAHTPQGVQHWPGCRYIFS